MFEHDILHACPPLTRGVKLVIRVDLCYAREDIDGVKLKDEVSGLDAVQGRVFQICERFEEEVFCR